jgi:hypothetical protein
VYVDAAMVSTTVPVIGSSLAGAAFAVGAGGATAAGPAPGSVTVSGLKWSSSFDGPE